jgi:PAS domain S-box-containing protein
MSSSLRLKVNLGFALALVILCVVGGAAFWNTQRFAQAARERRQGFEVRIRLAGVLADLRDAETSQRGYLLTGHPQYLGPFVSGSSSVVRNLRRLHQVAGKDSLEQRQLGRLEPLIQAKLAELGHTVTLREEGRSQEALGIVTSGQGKQLMDSIRQVAASLDAQAAERVDAWDARLSTTSRIALFTMGSTGLLAILLAFVAALVINRAISRRTQARDALRESESRLFQVLEALPVAVFVGDATGTPYYANQASREILGKGIVPVTPGELAEVYQAYQASTNQLYPTHRLPLMRALAGERAYVTDLEIHQPERVIPVDCWSAPVFDAAGQVVWAIVVFSDTTERRRAETELRSSEERARLIVDAAYDAFVAIDSDSVFTTWNRQAEATFGWSREEAIGRSLVETIIPPQHREAHRRGLAHFLATGEGPVLNRRIEITALRRSGEEFPVELAIWPLRLGERYYFNAFLRDITERKRGEEELRQAKEAAETANYAKSDFLAKMSHELRTPLNSIIGFSEMLQDKSFGALNEKQHRYVSNVLTSGRGLLQLINDILDLSKVEAGHMDLALSEFEIGTALAEVRTIVGTLVNKKHLGLEVEVESGLPTLEADQGKVKQVLYNLLSNAIKFTPEGGNIRVTARRASEIEAREIGEWIEIAVADTGIGLRPEDKQRIFGEFEQVDAGYTRNQEGTGLGLALSRKLVELHGGWIWVESEPGAGSIFRFVLPFAQREGTPDTRAVDAQHEASTGGLLILVVEDDQLTRELLTHQLTDAGYRVAQAATGEQGVALAKELRPAGITLDILLPDGDGLDVLAQLKSLPETRDIPVIVVSITEHQELGLSLGAMDWVVKPLNRSDFLAAVRRVFARTGSKAAATVLVVDDEAPTVELLTDMLGSQGYRVLSASDGRRGIEVARAERPDLIVLDLLMPETTGFEVVRELRMHPESREIPILIFTVKDLSPEERERLRGSVQAIVTKGATADLLRELARVRPTHPAK